MTADELRSAIKEQPFRPFRIRMVDGRRFDVQHPEFVALSPNGRIALAFSEAGTHSVLDLRLMSELEIGEGQRG